MMQLLIGTSNPGKLREYGLLLAPLSVRLLSLKDAGLESVDIEEPFDTYIENALHKARRYADLSGLPTLADDSGLSVDALDGRPGVYSARYAGGGDRDRYMKLLGELEGVPDEQRTARFTCVIALVFPADTHPPVTTVGVVEGRIAHEPTEGGQVGFGYDFVFIPQGYAVAFSALPMNEKNHLSHRGIAIRAMMSHLETWIKEKTNTEKP